MNLDVSMQSLKNLFSFPFHDKKWQEKFLIGSAMVFAGTIIPVIPWLAVLGYGARLMRAGARNEDAARLPAWDEWGDLFMDGLRQFGVSFIMSLPGMALIIAGWVFYTISVVSTIASSESYGMSSNPGAGMGFFVGMMAMFIGIGLGMVFSLIGGLLYPPAAGHVATQRRFGALFQVKEWWKVLRSNLGGFFVALFMALALYFGMMLVLQVMYMTIILCMVIPFALAPLGFYVMVVFSRLIGQAYGDGAAKAGFPVAVEPPPAPVEQPAEPLPASDIL